jgi:hypothetical protein
MSLLTFAGQRVRPHYILFRIAEDLGFLKFFLKKFYARTIHFGFLKLQPCRENIDVEISRARAIHNRASRVAKTVFRNAGIKWNWER